MGAGLGALDVPDQVANMGMGAGKVLMNHLTGNGSHHTYPVPGA